MRIMHLKFSFLVMVLWISTISPLALSAPINPVNPLEDLGHSSMPDTASLEAFGNSKDSWWKKMQNSLKNSMGRKKSGTPSDEHEEAESLSKYSEGSGRTNDRHQRKPSYGSSSEGSPLHSLSDSEEFNAMEPIPGRARETIRQHQGSKGIQRSEFSEAGPSSSKPPQHDPRSNPQFNSYRGLDNSQQRPTYPSGFSQLAGYRGPGGDFQHRPSYNPSSNPQFAGYKDLDNSQQRPTYPSGFSQSASYGGAHGSSQQYPQGTGYGGFDTHGYVDHYSQQRTSEPEMQHHYPSSTPAPFYNSLPHGQYDSHGGPRSNDVHNYVAAFGLDPNAVLRHNEKVLGGYYY